MKIRRLEIFHAAMPLIEPWRTAYGEDSAVHSVFCRMSGNGMDGWGECAPLAAPCYSPEFAAGVFQVLKDWLAPALLGHEIENSRQLEERLAQFKGNPFAKACLDQAWWALHSKACGKPLHELLGARRNESPVGADFGVMDSIEALLEAVGEAVRERFPRIKLKFRPGWDFPVLEAVRARFPDAVFHIDCNAGYRLRDLETFRRIDAFGLAMIEQPLQHDDLIDHAKLQAAIRTPVCLDESISHPRHAEQALALGSCRWVNIKPGRVGGLTHAVAIHDLCQKAGIPCWIGGMLESACGAAHCAALAMLPNCSYPPDVFPSSRFYREDLCDPPIVLSRDAGGAPCIQAPLLLPEPHPKRLDQCVLQRAALRP